LKRIRIPGVVDIVRSDDAAEIKSFAKDFNLDREYSDRSVPVNGHILKQVRETLQVNGVPFPTVTPRCDEGRAAAQTALWERLSALARDFAAGPDRLEGLAAYVRGGGQSGSCGLLVQQVVGSLFVPNFTATSASWDAALLLDKAPRTMNPALLAWWAVTKQVDKAKKLLSDMVGGDLAAVHAIGIALHNIVSGVNAMREIYKDPSIRATLTPQSARSRCLFAPASVIRQPAGPDNSNNGLNPSTLVVLDLQTANAKSPDENLVFLRQTWSQCPAEQWVPALLEGIWRRACASG
jgi:hypothetical protein